MRFPHDTILLRSSLRSVRVLDEIRRFPAQFPPNHMVTKNHVGFGPNMAILRTRLCY